MTAVITYVVAVSTWLSPMPPASSGWIVYYGSQSLVEANADYRGYTLQSYKDKCGFATMSPYHLGDIGWFLLSDGSWYGPCLAVDVSALKDFYANVYTRKEIAEVGPNIRIAMDFEYGELGIVYMGLCPPKLLPAPEPYRPPLRIVSGPARPPSMYPYPQQQLPRDCRSREERKIDGYQPLDAYKRPDRVARSTIAQRFGELDLSPRMLPVRFPGACSVVVR